MNPFISRVRQCTQTSPTNPITSGASTNHTATATTPNRRKVQFMPSLQDDSDALLSMVIAPPLKCTPRRPIIKTILHYDRLIYVLAGCMGSGDCENFRWFEDAECEKAPSEPPTLPSIHPQIGDIYLHRPNRSAGADEVTLWVRTNVRWTSAHSGLPHPAKCGYVLVLNASSSSAAHCPGLIGAYYRRVIDEFVAYLFSRALDRVSAIYCLFSSTLTTVYYFKIFTVLLNNMELAWMPRTPESGLNLEAE